MPTLTAEVLGDSLVAAWKTNNRVTTYLIENLPEALWDERVPAAPGRTVRMIGAHLHNNRCMWIKMVGKKVGIAVPQPVDRLSVSPSQLLAALDRSSRGILDMLLLGLENGGRLPTVAWQNYPSDVVHFLAYHVAHEGHHRGQIVMLARQLGHRLPTAITTGLWQWSKRAREVGQ
ncbi:MAG: DinB family protein [Gemmatimonadetes bacterium]|nr:DinB family protein [Gemmatimonadota bacterium]